MPYQPFTAGVLVRRVARTLSLLLLFAPLLSADAQALPAGALDPTFGSHGKVMTNFGNSLYHAGADVIVLPNGKLIVAGSTNNSVPPLNANFSIARLNADGSLDTSFGTGGQTIFDFAGFDDFAFSAVLQADGKIVVGGRVQSTNNFSSNDFGLVRFNSDGSVDTGFGTGGKVTTDFFGSRDDVLALVIQPDGKTVACGLANNNAQGQPFALARYNPDGSLDTTFDTDGKVTTNFATSGSGYGFGVALQPDGKIVAVGTAYGISNIPAVAVARYHTDGSLDPSFDMDGKVYTFVFDLSASASDVAIQADGKIVVAGQVQHSFNSDFDFALVRYNSDGSLDTGFGTGGKLRTDFNTGDDRGQALALQADGKIVAGGSSGGGFYNFAVARYLTNGSLDTSFGTGGKVVTDFNNQDDMAAELALQPDGKIVVVGGTSSFDGISRTALARYLGSARTPFDFDGDGKADLSVFRPSSGTWYIQASSDGALLARPFGQSGDILTPADFDGDGKTDLAVFRPANSTWYRLNSSDHSFLFEQFGASGDIAVPQDFDGDGRADLAVFRPSTGGWYWKNSSNGSVSGQQFGASGDKPAPGDFDGDGKADVAVFRPSSGAWYRLNSSDGQVVGLGFGLAEDQPTPADYDGDGRTGIAVYRPSTGAWYRVNSGDGSVAGVAFGSAGDKPAASDYDGDGKADIAVFRPQSGYWYLLRSTAGFSAASFGISEDLPVPAAFVY